MPSSESRALHARRIAFTRAMSAGSVVLTVALLAACGGGGSGEPSAPQAYSIGGSVTGLTGTLTLQLNDANDLSITSAGSFSFSTNLPANSSYAVTVHTQPVGQACTVTGGTGVATANVANVSVACAPDTAAFWAPLRAQPTGSGPGTTGLYVLSTDTIAAAPTRITSEYAVPVDYMTLHSIGVNGMASAGHPSQFIYAAPPVGGGDARLWALDTSATSTLVPRQLSNLSLPFLQFKLACQKVAVYRNLNDPATLFFLLQLPSDGFSGACDNEWTLVRATDTASTTPTIVSIPPNNVEPLYRPDGSLAGLAMINANHELRYYTDETFSSSMQLLTGVNTFARVSSDTPSPFSHLPRSPTTMLFWTNSPTGQRLHRLSHTGQLSLIFSTTESMEPEWSDDQFYVFKILRGTDPVTTDYYSIETQTGTTAKLISSVTQPAAEPRLEVTSASGSTLLLMQAFYTSNLSSNYTRLWTMPTDQAGTQTQIATINSNVYSAYLLGNSIYVTRMVAQSNGFPTTWDYSTTVLGLDGSVTVSQRDNSIFTGVNPLLLLDAGTYYQASLSGNTLDRTLIQRSDGTPATFSMAPYEFTYVSMYEPGFSMGSSTNATGGWRALAFDSTRSRMATIDFPYSFTYFLTSPRF